MVFLVWVRGVKMLLSLCVAPCFVDIPGILGHILVYHCVFLTTNSFSWLIPSFCVVLDIQYLVGYGCHWAFHLEVVYFLEHRFCYLCRQFCFLPIIVHLFSPTVLLLLVPLFGFSWFILVFLLPLLVDVLCKGDWAQDSRRILSNIIDCGYGTTHLQENPQRLGWGFWRNPLHYIHLLVSGLAGLELN